MRLMRRPRRPALRRPVPPRRRGPRRQCPIPELPAEPGKRAAVAGARWSAGFGGVRKAQFPRQFAGQRQSHQTGQLGAVHAGQPAGGPPRPPAGRITTRRSRDAQPQSGGQALGSGHRAQFGRYQQQGEVELDERLRSGCVELPGQVDHDGLGAAPCGAEQALHRVRPVRRPALRGPS